MSAKIIWFTGLSGSGKSTIAKKLLEALITKTKIKKSRIKLVDGDLFRKKTKQGKPLTKINIVRNNKKIINYLSRVEKKYDYILVTVIAPFAITRSLAKKIFKNRYFEVLVHCKKTTLIKRDPKGLYKKGLNMIGVNSSIKYEKTLHKKIIIDTDLNSIKKSVKIIFYRLRSILK